VDELPARAEVVIVGGGFAGASTAWWLARRGITDVVVIEREALCGSHASGRNAALCRQLADDDDTTRLTVRGAQLLREPPAELSGAPLVATTGGILTADDDAGLDELVARADAHGVDHRRVGVAEVVARWPALAGLRAAGGVLVPGDGVIDIAAVLAALTTGARRAGVRIVTRCELRALAPEGDGVTVETSRGPIRARVLVCGAGAWAGVVGALAGVDAPFVAIKRHLFVTQALVDVPAGPDPHPPWVWHLGREQFYVRPEGTGLLLSHCDERAVPPADVAPDDGAAERLAERIRSAAPGLAGLKVRRAWACLRTFAPDHRMRIAWDPDQPWLCWVAGLGGHGATSSLAVGERAASELAARL